MGYTDSTSFRGTTTPVAVVGGLAFASLSAGGDATCGIALDGAAYCWGFGSALGHAATDVCWGYDSDLPPSVQCSFRPVAVEGGLIFASLSVGWQGACGLTTTGRAYCWGMYPATNGQSATPVEVSGGLIFAGISMGIGAPNGPTCGVTSGGAIYCWGWLVVGGESSWVDTEPTNEPREVPGGVTFGSVSAGSHHICGMTLPGAVYCWGYGGPNGLIGSTYGLLGTASGSIYSLAPAKVAGQP
jgi:alpha-tubulin suppressor-like RCC1 family protein